MSLGAGVSWSGLEALDGVEHLYSLADGIDQSGHAVDYRLGLFSNREGRHFEAVIVHNRFSMTHDVTYIDWVWDDTHMVPILTTRLETNEDETRTTGFQLGFARPITESGWRIGGTWTVNRKSHPKIPNYEIMNIPRDPGTSWAYDFGIGIAKSSGPATFGIDLVFEPIWSDTWVEAEADTTSADGAVINKGEKTIENEFFFTNLQMRLGLAHETEWLTFQVGVEVRSHDYTLEQRDNIENTLRDEDESWIEWTPSFGAKVKFLEFELGYVARMTTGSGRPGVQWTGPRAQAAMDRRLHRRAQQSADATGCPRAHPPGDGVDPDPVRESAISADAPLDVDELAACPLPVLAFGLALQISGEIGSGTRGISELRRADLMDLPDDHSLFVGAEARHLQGRA